MSGKRLRPASGTAGSGTAGSGAAGSGAAGSGVSSAVGGAGGAADGAAEAEAEAAGGAAAEYEAFFAMLNAQFCKYKAVLPVDLRARGLVSAKYGHDGTGLV